MTDTSAIGPKELKVMVMRVTTYVEYDYIRSGLAGTQCWWENHLDRC